MMSSRPMRLAEPLNTGDLAAVARLTPKGAKTSSGGVAGRASVARWARSPDVSAGEGGINQTS